MMTEHEYAAIIDALPRVERLIMMVALEGGPKTVASDFRPATSLANQHTDQLRHLQRIGMLRCIGKPRGDHSAAAARRYEAVPPEQVEQAQDAYAKIEQKQKQRATGTRKKRPTKPTRGDRHVWIQFRHTTMQLAQQFEALADEHAWWDDVPLGDVDGILEEVELMMRALQGTLDELGTRAKYDAHQARLRKLAATAGRTEHEIAAAKTLIARMENSRRVLDSAY
jgi:hypothetical protein